MTRSLHAQLQACVGDVLDPDRRGRDPVNVPMIRNWCDALDDANPVYLDEVAARRAGFPGIVAPPGMLRTWTMLAPSEQMLAPAEAPGSVYGLLEEAGFTSKAATNCNQRFVRYLVPGDEVHAVTRLSRVSDEKRTALGPGYFVDSSTSFYDGDDHLVAEMDWRSLRYRPGERRPATAPSPAAAPAGGDQEEAAPPAWRVPITPTLIIAGAMASRDYQDVHHDAELARQRGTSDIFTNMMTTAGLVSRYVTDWTGPTARLLTMALTLGAPNHPGDMLVMTAAAVPLDGTEAGPATHRLAITGANGLGRHVHADVTFTRQP